MKNTIRVVALVATVTLVAGCGKGLGLRSRNAGDGTVKLPAAPTIDANPAETGTVGTPSPPAAPMVPSASPFDGN